MDFCLEFNYFPTNGEYDFALTYLHLETNIEILPV